MTAVTRKPGGVCLLSLAASIALGTALCSPLAAQSGFNNNKPTRQSLDRLLDERRRSLVKKGAEVDRIMDLLIRNHLGLAPASQAFGLTDAERVRERGEVETELADNLHSISTLGKELEKKRAFLDARRKEIMDGAKRATIRRPGAQREAPGGDPIHGATNPSDVGSTAQAPSLPRPPRQATTQPANHRPKGSGRKGQPVLVRGTLDPRRLGRALYAAGNYKKAKSELEKVTAGKDAALLDVFLLAKCYEKLDDFARAHGLWLRIEEADTRTAPDGARTLGHWANAAQTARQHMDWLRNHGKWKPALPGAPGETQR